MYYYFKNSVIAIKKIAQLLKHDVLKHPVDNYFKKNYSKRVLISYITKPFNSGIELTHTNFIEVLEIAKIFNSMSYIVDVVDYNYEGYIEYDKYNVIFGFGEPLINSFHFDLSKEVKRIYYGTGMHISIQNHNTLKRIFDVKNKKGMWILESGRIVDKAWSEQTTLVDAMIVLGNDEVKKSYQKYFDKEIFSISPSFYNVCDYKEIISSKNFEEAKNNYLWFGSNGLIHKGLDLLLETFKSFPDLHLHICGPIDSELKFKNVYYDELYKTSNIHTYGFVKIDTELFKDLLNKCAFIIYPSCSEGGSPSIINVCGNGGLIPILTKEVTLNTNDFGIQIEDYKIYNIKAAINISQNYSIDEIINLSKISGERMSNFTLHNFSDQIKYAIDSIISNKN